MCSVWSQININCQTKRCYTENEAICMLDFVVDFWCFNSTFSNISAISWRPVLVMEEAGVPEENHRPMSKQLVNFITCGC